jgi:hypothetical protein
MFFNKFTQSNLQVKAFNTMKHEIHRLEAVDVLTLSINLCIFSRRLLTENTIRRSMFLQKTDKLGIEMKFLLYKPSGYIQVCVRKKRNADINVYFMESNFKKITDHYYYHIDCNENWVKLLLFEFDRYVIGYIRNGFSNKLKHISGFIQQYLICGNKKTPLSVYIDIPGYLYMI